MLKLFEFELTQVIFENNLKYYKHKVDTVIHTVTKFALKTIILATPRQLPTR